MLTLFRGTDVAARKACLANIFAVLVNARGGSSVPKMDLDGREDCKFTMSILLTP